ncbi:MAG: site-specific DNA-methyltransferase, partial [Candidatus Rokuibacteriota bacterium]
MKKRRRNSSPSDGPTRVAESYGHYDARSPMRPDAGTQPQFRKKKPPKTYRYDSSLSPALDWDGQNPARELGEWLLGLVERAAGLPAPHAFDSPQEFRASDGAVLATIRSLEEAVEQLGRLGQPFLDWAGKAERLSFDVPTLPLFVHERLSTKAIVETLVGHHRDKQESMFELFGDPRHSITDQVLKAYEYQDRWVNRLILGDSLVVMNSLLQYEGLGGQVQMIYMDPPYGVKFGSNFQPFVRKRDVSHNDDEDMTREPEMVKAYRDTWELGLHSYLTYMRDRLLLARELLSATGSIFVQISDENLHHVRELLDDLFSAENLVAIVPFRKKTMPLGAKYLERMYDYLVWYAKDREDLRYRQLYVEQDIEDEIHWTWYELPDGSRHRMRPDQRKNHTLLPPGARVFRLVSMWPPTFSPSAVFTLKLGGKTYMPPTGQCWPTGQEGMQKLMTECRLQVEGDYLRYVLYYDDYRLTKLTAVWHDTTGARDQRYVIETAAKVVERCLLMTTDPGDLVLDPTCGSGTT